MLQNNLNKIKSHKLSEYLQIPINFQKPHENNKLKKLHRTFYHEQSKIQTDSSETPLTQVTQQPVTSSFYDGFQFVDRLTNNKMIYRDVRRGTNSLMHVRTSSSPRVEQRAHFNSLLRIYKKTKTFQMNSLKNKIFKKIQSGKQLPQKTQTNLQDAPQLKQKKHIKSSSLTLTKPLTACQVVERSRKKNRLKQFLERTVMDMNKAELQRMVSEKDTVQEEVLQFNEDLMKIKCTMNRDKINDLMYLRQKQQHDSGKTNHFRQSQKQDQPQTTEVRTISENKITKSCLRQKKKKTNSLTKENENFLEKMLTHARNDLRKKCEYLIPPKKLNIYNSMLMKKNKSKFFGSTIRTQQTESLQGFQFDKKPQSPLISQVKSLVYRPKRHQAFTSGGERQYKWQMPNTDNSIINLLKSNYISNLGLQLITNPNACWAKDSKGNNLLHLAVKYQKAEIIDFLFRKLPYRTCRILLSQKNSNKRIPLEMAKLVVDVRAIEIIEKFVEENRQNQIMEGWLDSGEQKESPE